MIEKPANKNELMLLITQLPIHFLQLSYEIQLCNYAQNNLFNHSSIYSDGAKSHILM